MSEIWNEEAIGKVCNKVSLMGIPPFYVTAADKMEGFSWIIAPYRDLRVIAPLLRTFEDHASPAKSGEIRRHDNDELRNILDELGVRFGQRRTDVPPHGDRVTRIGERMTPSEIIALKTLELESRWAGERSSGGGQPFEARVRELHPEVERFWISRTLEAHHIIEKSILGNLGVNTGDLKNSVAPCVLAFAELHQRFYTAKLAGERAGFSEKMPGTKAEEELLRIYLGVPGDDKKRHGGLYDTPRMEPLKKVSEIIIAEARVRLTK